jgi:hypothetical protein
MSTGDALDYLPVGLFKKNYEEHPKSPFSPIIRGSL